MRFAGGTLRKHHNGRNASLSKPFINPYLFYFPQLTLVRILMAQDTSDSRQQVADLLDQLYEFLTSVHNKQFQINVLALQALYRDTLGEKSAALG